MWCCLRHAQFRPVRRTTSLQPARVRRASACSGTRRPNDTATARSSCTSCSTTTDATRPTTGRPTPPRRPSSSTDFSRPPTMSSTSERTRAKAPDRGVVSCISVQPTCCVSVVFTFRYAYERGGIVFSLVCLSEASLIFSDVTRLLYSYHEHMHLHDYLKTIAFLFGSYVDWR